MKIGNRLRSERDRRMLTQEELGEKAGLAPYTISRIEAGHTEPRYSTVKKLARALDIDPLELWREEETEPPKAAAPTSSLMPEEDADEERGSRYLRSLRAFVWKLVKRWREDPPESEREITIVLDTMQALLEEGAFERPAEEITTADMREVSEWFELRSIFIGLERLNRIADTVETNAAAEKRRAAFEVIKGRMSA
jgi:transcriptional regulator with XRE-family HTH domain